MTFCILYIGLVHVFFYADGAWTHQYVLSGVKGLDELSSLRLVSPSLLYVGFPNRGMSVLCFFAFLLWSSLYILCNVLYWAVDVVEVYEVVDTARTLGIRLPALASAATMTLTAGGGEALADGDKFGRSIAGSNSEMYIGAPGRNTGKGTVIILMGQFKTLVDRPSDITATTC
jgi:hypothetical protein